jgi:DNA polymerase III delta prime subunit
VRTRFPRPTTYESRVEKYRPIFLDDIVGNSETVERLKIIAKDGNMPHVIISGMPGIGKTTSILCLARQLLGPAYKEAVLELNASDERGQGDLMYGCNKLTWGLTQASMLSAIELKDSHRRRSRCLRVGTRS